MAETPEFQIDAATADDVPTILRMVQGLAEYEKLSHEVVATPQLLEKWLFGERPVAEVLIADWDASPRGFALFFHNFSTFLGKPGFYLEDLYVEPEFRGRGIGKALLLRLANIAVERGYGRVEWSVLDWNEPSIASFSGQYKDFNPCISPDGSKLFFISNRPVNEKKKTDPDIWYCNKKNDGWAEPINIGEPVNTAGWELGCSVAADGTLYYSSTGTTGDRRASISSTPSCPKR